MGLQITTLDDFLLLEKQHFGRIFHLARTLGL
jgi:hypothetical protein